MTFSDLPAKPLMLDDFEMTCTSYLQHKQALKRKQKKTCIIMVTYRMIKMTNSTCLKCLFVTVLG